MTPPSTDSVPTPPFTGAIGISGRLVWTLRCVCLIALSVSAYLAWVSMTTTPVYGCGGDVFDCGHVLTSAWSKWFGIPVSVPAVALYASLLAVLAFMTRSAPPRLVTAGWKILTAGAVAAGTAAAWFIGLQLFTIGRLCVYCLTAHVCGLALTAVVLWKRPLGLRSTLAMSSTGFVAALVLVGGQLLTPAEPTWVVEHFDQPDSAGQADVSPADVARSDVAPDDFDGPGAFVEAPDDVFSAPSEDPETEAVPALAVPAVLLPADAPDADADAAANSDAPQNADTSPDVTSRVAASLLILLPVDLPILDLMLVPESSEDGNADAAAESNTAQNDSGQPAAAESVVPKDTPAAAPARPEPRIIGAAGDKFRLNIRQWPLLGKPDAKFVFVEMFDYTCPHCRNTHVAIREALRRYGDDLAVVALAVPLHPGCNKLSQSGNSQNAESCELARLALAVWRIQPAEFMGFHDWMFDAGRNRTAAEARKHAEQLVGAEPLRKELARKTVGEYISRHVELYQKVGSGSVPKLLFPRSMMTGEVSSVTALSQMIDREMVTR